MARLAEITDKQLIKSAPLAIGGASQHPSALDERLLLFYEMPRSLARTSRIIAAVHGERRDDHMGQNRSQLPIHLTSTTVSTATDNWVFVWLA